MWLSILIPILLTILVIVCVLLTLVVLMQRPKNEGLGAAFGSGVTENIFGAQTASVLVKATVYLGCFFFGVTLLLTVLTARRSLEQRTGVLENEVRKAAVPAAPQVSVSPAASGSATAIASATPAASATVSATASSKASSSPAPSASPTAEASASPAPSASPQQ
jgi:preprotein translocase subunit SecG